MSTNAPAQKRDRSCPFSETFGATDVAAPINLTARVVSAATGGTPGTPRVAPYLNPTSSLILIPKAATWAVTYKDCAGTSNVLSFATATIGVGFELPVGATELTSTTSCLVIALWHGGGVGQL